MNIIYNILIYLTSLVLKVIALFNHKIKLGVKGRANTFDILKNEIKKSDKTLWFHCASLGEYEQGLPVFNVLRIDYPKHKIILTFFSPSGYEIRKNAPFADVVVYLPLDTKSNAKRFINLVNPELTVFVKYEIWPNYLNEIKKNGLRAVLISAVFRKDQSFFKWYGTQTKQALFAFEHIFTQNEESKNLLESIGYKNATVSGDTRFDRVLNQLQIDNTLDFIETFKQDKLCIVIGSSWPEDEAILVPYINQCKHDVKFIIAPHNIKAKQIEGLKQSIQKETALFSNKENTDHSNASVFIIDTIGILSKIYSYADIAYIGGAMGKTGLHNILEPAVFGVPIIIGFNYKKFPEAQAMIDNGNVFSVNDYSSLKNKLDLLIENKIFRKETSKKSFNFVKEKEGTIIQIIGFLRK
ncbi:3-deoxy-D-manno-octulosonic acid transferase [Mesoflavibacter sp. SCSIO 43206]|uniref:3-deoxy-D-manno-octulosonic acid transferase n=1 Tax=Mesoflavibacter sp. SCSIO 43206 TaxID=2779362 RepID=UPI001CA7E9B3|nr:glycosyltransferase N-terminal domain-containing protein [Mesoflavibacter sp. SCSIO 43206]UAB74249.1 3-deoxy-D-manno-octulosonic acid transferase [Mesoflavibacter sp. SCSIO 43206]